MIKKSIGSDLQDYIPGGISRRTAIAGAIAAAAGAVVAGAAVAAGAASRRHSFSKRDVIPQWTVGDLRIDRIEEFCGPVFTLDKFLVDLPPDAVERNLDWLVPNFIDPVSKFSIMTDQSWIVRTKHHAIVIETCWGNHKPRPGFGANLNTPWLDRLAALGLRPEDIDFVMCTHLHADHIGWNTRLVDGRWIPTFPNARYLFGRAEYEYWSTTTDTRAGREGFKEAIADSILPCIEAGLAQLVDGPYGVGDNLVMTDAPGHTKGHMIITARSKGQSAVFCGDVFHVPLQFAYPDLNSIVCDFPDQARATRRRVFGECADHNHLLFPNHVPAPYIGRVRRMGDGFRFTAGA